MHVLRKFAVFSIVVLGLVYADSDPLQDLIKEIDAAGLTTFAGLIPAIRNTKAGMSLIEKLATGPNFSLFIPSDDAFKEHSFDTTDTERVAKILSYHIVQDKYYCDGGLIAEHLPKVTIAHTLLDDPDYVQLEDEKASQVLAWGKNNDRDGEFVEFENQPNPTRVTATHLIQGYPVFTINHVFTIPPDLSSVLDTPETSKLKHIMDQSRSQTSIPDLKLLEENRLHGFTLLAPNDAAFDKLGQGLSELNASQVLSNHIISHKTLYSTNFADSTTMSGQDTKFKSNDSGRFVHSGGLTAKILWTDKLVIDGVVHIIDSVLGEPLPTDEGFTSFTPAPSKGSSPNSINDLKTAGEGSWIDDWR